MPGTLARRSPELGRAVLSYLLPVWLQLPPRTAISLMQDGRSDECFAGSGLTCSGASCAGLRVLSQPLAGFLP